MIRLTPGLVAGLPTSDLLLWNNGSVKAISPMESKTARPVALRSASTD